MNIEKAKQLVKSNTKKGVYPHYTKLQFIANVSSSLSIINSTNCTDEILYNVYKKNKKKVNNKDVIKRGKN